MSEQPTGVQSTIASDARAKIGSASEDSRATRQGQQDPLAVPVLGWAESLTRLGHQSLYESMVAELAVYLREPPATVEAACAAAAATVAGDWEAAPPGKERPPNERRECNR